MKKLRFSFLIMAVMTAVCFTACTNKDDDSNDVKSSIVTPKYRDGGIACIIKLNPAITLDDGSKLLSVEFTESGRAYTTIEKDGKQTTYNAPFKYENGNYTIDGDRVSATFKDQTTHGSQNKQYLVYITIKTASGGVLAKTDSETAINVVKTVGDLVGDVDIISSWSVRGICIDVDGDYKFFKEFPDGDLKKILNYAKTEHNVKFTEKEEKELSKVVQYVSVSTKHITIDYADGTSDVADWNWAGSLYDKVEFELDEHSVGNKFIVSDPAVKIEFNKPKAYLNVVFSAEINDGDKNYNSSLTLRLIQQPEFTIPAVD
jgi:hypothetical protein